MLPLDHWSRFPLILHHSVSLICIPRMFVCPSLCQKFLEDTAVATLHLLSLQMCGENLNTEMWQATLSQLFNVDHKKLQQDLPNIFSFNSCLTILRQPDIKRYVIHTMHQYIIRHVHLVIHHLWHKLTPSTCFSMELPSSGSHYNKGIQAKMPIKVLFLFTRMTKILKMLKYIKLIIIIYSNITSHITIHNKPPQLPVVSCFYICRECTQNTGFNSMWSEKISTCKYMSIVLGNQICIYHIYSNARQGFFLNFALK